VQKAGGARVFAMPDRDWAGIAGSCKPTGSCENPAKATLDNKSAESGVLAARVRAAWARRAGL